MSSQNFSVIEDNGTMHVIKGISSTQKLSPGNYILDLPPMSGYILKKQEDWKLPTKIYGDLQELEFYIESVNKNSGNTGIFLLGEKGSGKTLHAKWLCKNLNRPVLIINDSDVLNNSSLLEFLNYSVFDDCVIYIDEFEKIFNLNKSREVSEDSISPLTLNLIKLLDGSSNNKFTFILTANENTIHELFKNRLNRIKYKKVYTQLSENEIEAIIEDMLVDKKRWKNDLMSELMGLDLITYDILITIINDINLLNVDPYILISRYNLYSYPKSFRVSFTDTKNSNKIELGLKSEKNPILFDYENRNDELYNIDASLFKLIDKLSIRIDKYNLNNQGILSEDVMNVLYANNIFKHFKKNEVSQFTALFNNIIQYLDCLQHETDVTNPMTEKNATRLARLFFKDVDSLIDGSLSYKSWNRKWCSTIPGALSRGWITKPIENEYKERFSTELLSSKHGVKNEYSDLLKDSINDYKHDEESPIISSNEVLFIENSVDGINSLFLSKEFMNNKDLYEKFKKFLYDVSQYDLVSDTLKKLNSSQLGNDDVLHMWYHSKHAKFKNIKIINKNLYEVECSLCDFNQYVEKSNEIRKCIKTDTITSICYDSTYNAILYILMKYENNINFKVLLTLNELQTPLFAYSNRPV